MTCAGNAFSGAANDAAGAKLQLELKLKEEQEQEQAEERELLQLLGFGLG